MKMKRPLFMPLQKRNGNRCKGSSQIANAITCSRIFLSIALLCFPVFSREFYCLYLTAGLSDGLDGIVARKTKTVSDFGARIDTLADTVFVSVTLMKILPVICLPRWMYAWFSVIALLKLANFLWELAKHRRLLAVHSISNKITGLLLFALPFTQCVCKLQVSAVVVCGMATIATIRESYLLSNAH